MFNLHRRATGLAAAFALLFAGSASAVTFYVSPTGNDANDGLAVARPMTFARALTRVNPGDSIEMLAGVYTGGLYINRPGTAQAWITVKPYGTDKAIIDGTGRTNALYFYRDDFAPMYWTIQDLEIRGGESYVVKIDTPQVRLINNNLHGSKNDIIKLVSTADDVWIYKNEIHHNNAANGANAQGVDIVGADRTWIAYNYVHDIPSIALYSKGNSRNTIFENNRVENVYQRGIMLGQSTDSWLVTDGRYETYDGIIRNNIIINTGGPCLATASSYNVKIYNNSCYNVASQFNGAIFISNESTLGQAGTNVEIKNNIVFRSATGTRPVVYIAPDAMTDMATLSIDNNIYWVPNGGAVNFAWERSPSAYNGNIANWRTLTNLDRNSVIVDPGYASTASLALAATSPAIDTAAAIPCAAKDYLDKERPADGNGDNTPTCDIGAYEYDGIAAPLPVPNTPPTVSLQTPANSASFTAPATVTLTATANDVDGGVTQVEFFNGTTRLATDTSAPYTFTWSAVPVGTYAITARATDTAGASTVSSVANITVAAAAPIGEGNGNGLAGEYFDNADFTAPKLTRTDATVNFGWAGAPDASVGGEAFSVRWTGQVEPRFSETYSFYTNSDDGVRLWVNGQLVIDNWSDHAAVENSGRITLTAGQKVDIRMDYYENRFDAVARLSWSSASQPKEIIPQTRLYSAAPMPTPLPEPPPPVIVPGEGAGLKGEYFDNIDFTNLMMTRVDAAVDFGWGANAPAPGMGTDSFAVRWTGSVQAQFGETYTFYTASDDGVRLWVNGQLIVNNWWDQAARETSGRITLYAGQKVSIRMEYYDNRFDAVARLAWSSASQPKQIIPQSRLYP